MVKAKPRLLYPREGDPVPTVQAAGRDLGSAWTAVENLAPTKVRSPEHFESPNNMYLVKSTNYAAAYGFIRHSSYDV